MSCQIPSILDIIASYFFKVINAYLGFKKYVDCIKDHEPTDDHLCQSQWNLDFVLVVVKVKR